MNYFKLKDVHTFDVLLSRGKTFHGHSGNIHYQGLISARSQRFKESGRHERTQIVDEVIDSIEHKGGSLKCFDEKTDSWIKIPRREQVKKIRQSLTDKRRQSKSRDRVYPNPPPHISPSPHPTLGDEQMDRDFLSLWFNDTGV